MNKIMNSMMRRVTERRLLLAALSVIAVVISMRPCDAVAEDEPTSHLDRKLMRILRDAGFKGSVEATLEARLGRPIDPAMADLGRLLFFAKAAGSA